LPIFRFHVFDLKTDQEKLSNVLKGTGSVKLRTSDEKEVARLRKHLKKQFGVVLLHKVEKDHKLKR